MTFGESLVFLVALLSGILDSIAAAAGAHGDNRGTSSIGISALNQLEVMKNLSLQEVYKGKPFITRGHEVS